MPGIIIGLAGVAYKCISAYLNCKAIDKAYKTMFFNWNLMKNRLFQKNQEPIRYRTYKIYTLTEIRDTVMIVINRNTAFERKILNRT